MPGRLVPRDFGTALSFDGTGQYVSVPSASQIDLTGDFTIKAWVFPTKYGAATNEFLEKGPLGSISTGSYKLAINSSIQKLVFTNVNVVDIIDNGPIIIPLGKWTQVVVTKSGNTYSFYTNGVLNSSTVDSNSLVSNTSPLIIGRRSVGTTSAFTGSLDAVEIIKGTALTSAQVLSSYLTGVRPVAPSALYKFNEGSGTTAIDDAFGNNGTISGPVYTNNVAMKLRVVPRDFGTSMYFPRNGSGKVVLKSGPIISGSANFTTTGWVKPDRASARQAPIYCERGASGLAILKFELFNGPSKGKPVLTYRNDAGTITQSFPADGTVNLQDDRWHFVAAVKNGTNVYLYVDGAQYGPFNTTVATPLTVTETRIGSDAQDNSAIFEGFIDAVKVWNRALTATEINSMYSAGVHPTGANGWWRFNESQGSIAYDDADGNNGTISGGAFYSTDVAYKTRKALIDFSSSVQMTDNSYGQADLAVTDARSWNGVTQLTGAYGFFFKLTGTKANNFQFFSPGFDRLDVNYETGSNKIFVFSYTTGGVNTLVWKSSVSMFDGQWHLILVNRTATAQEVYLDGVKVASNPNTDFAMQVSGNPRPNIGNGSILMANISVWKRSLTATEISQYFSTLGKLIPKDNLVLHWPTNNAASSRSYDSLSGNSNSLTLLGSGWSWSADIPAKRRAPLNANIIYNGDMENVPPAYTNADQTPQTTTNNQAVIDGTGNTIYVSEQLPFPAVKNRYTWAFLSFNSLAKGADYDTSVKHSGNASIKIFGTQVKERTQTTMAARIYGDLNVPYDIANHTFPLLPNTTYDVSYWVKQNAANVVGAPEGTRLELNIHSPTGQVQAQKFYPPSPYGTFDWIQVTGSITTNSQARYLNMNFGIYGNSTNYYDATVWYDDIVITPRTSGRVTPA